MKEILLSLVFGWCVLAQADLVLELDDDGRAVTYADGGRVYFEVCPKGVKPARGCSGKSVDDIYSTDHDRFARSVQSFYGLVDRQYAGLSGPPQLDVKIQNLQQHLEHDEFLTDELKKAEAVLLELVRKRDKLEAAQREILQYLARGHDGTLSEEYQVQRFSAVNLSFYPVTYSANRHQIFRLSEGVTVDQVDNACQRFSKEWRLVGGSIDRGLRAELASTPILAPGEITRVWTSSAGPRGGYYKVTCIGSYSRTPIVRTYMPEDLRRTEESASRAYGGMSLCAYTTNGSEAGREFVPSSTTVVDLGAVSFDVADAQEPVQAGENSLIGTLHPVLCQKDYDYKPGDAENGYLNGDHFADFSIYGLEGSLEKMAKSVYLNRADFFRQIAKALAAYPLRDGEDLKLGFQSANARLFVLLAIEPLLHDIQSHFVDRYVLPDYNRSKDQWSKRLGVAALSDIDLSAPTYRLALELLRSGLQASAPYLTADDRKAAEVLAPAIGKAMAAGPASVKTIAGELSKNHPLFDRMTSGRRTHGFGVLATLVAGYLELHAQ